MENTASTTTIEATEVKGDRSQKVPRRYRVFKRVVRGGDVSRRVASNDPRIYVNGYYPVALTSVGTRLRIKVELMKATPQLSPATCARWLRRFERADVRNCSSFACPPFLSLSFSVCRCYKWCVARKVLLRKPLFGRRWCVYVSVRGAFVCIIRENVIRC